MVDIAALGLEVPKVSHAHDQHHADTIRALVQSLNSAMEIAAKTGLHVTLDEAARMQRTQINFASTGEWPHIVIEVKRPL